MKIQFRPSVALLAEYSLYPVNNVMPLVGGQKRLKPILNLGIQLTLFEAGRADHAHHITACPPGY